MDWAPRLLRLLDKIFLNLFSFPFASVKLGLIFSFVLSFGRESSCPWSLSRRQSCQLGSFLDILILWMLLFYLHSRQVGKTVKIPISHSEPCNSIGWKSARKYKCSHLIIYHIKLSILFQINKVLKDTALKDKHSGSFSDDKLWNSVVLGNDNIIWASSTSYNSTTVNTSSNALLILCKISEAKLPARNGH